MRRMFTNKKNIGTELLLRSSYVAFAAALLANNAYPCPDLQIEQCVGQVAHEHASTYTMTHCQQVALIETMIDAC